MEYEEALDILTSSADGYYMDDVWYQAEDTIKELIARIRGLEK